MSFSHHISVKQYIRTHSMLLLKKYVTDVIYYSYKKEMTSPVSATKHPFSNAQIHPFMHLRCLLTI